MILGTTSSRSKCWQVQFLLRSFSMTHRWLSSSVSSHGHPFACAVCPNLLLRIPVLLNQELPSGPPFNFTSKSSVSKYSHVLRWVRASTYTFCGNTIQPTAVNTYKFQFLWQEAGRSRKRGSFVVRPSKSGLHLSIQQLFLCLHSLGCTTWIMSK